ncbi:vascular endothelial growth factor C-like [Salvelinus namaycush]|uniref:Vascular endothelial growth factor C n=1 Tax=Salvelinus namaycush TaxID=8040 RepID=A0A8U0UID9_SALNM|nr:vascular endothelial growth factor C-like [Salvelinus namaycush]
MHLFGISVLLANSAILYANLASESSHEFSHDYYDYDQDQGEAPEPSEPDLEQQLRSVASVDELMRIVYPNYYSMLSCRSKRGARFTLRGEHTATETRLSGELPAYAGAPFNPDTLKSIESEWKKTQCMPREVCLDVGKEFGAATNTFYKPPCVSVYRCGGCCNSEAHQCMNISTSYISKTLFEITVSSSTINNLVTISFANHTVCNCLSKLDAYKQVHSIIRRSLPECLVANKTCPKNHSWSNRLCRCMAVQRDTPSPPQTQRSDSFEADVCGSDKELDEETCQCVCRRQRRASGACGLHRYLDKNTCQCVCKTLPSSCGPHQLFNKDTCQCVCKTLPSSCRPHQLFNKDTCQCSCARTCPKHQPLNRTKCACECNESPNRCFLKGKRFHQATCSCYGPPCDVRRNRRCASGFYFSEEVCRCVPTYWRRQD